MASESEQRPSKGSTSDPVTYGRPSVDVAALEAELAGVGIRPKVAAHGDSDEDEDERTAALKRRKLTTVLMISLLAAMCSGTCYGLSAFQSELIERFAFTATDTDLVFTLAFWATVAEPGGFLFAVYGSRPVLRYGGCFICVGIVSAVLMLGTLTTERWLGHSDVWLLALAFAAIAQGSSAMYTTALMSTVHCFEGSVRQGVAIGVVSSGFGLSAALWVTVYQVGFHHKMQAFYVMFGFLYSIVIGTYACLVYTPPPRNGFDPIDEMCFTDAQATVEDTRTPQPVNGRQRKEGSSCAAVLRVIKAMLRTSEFLAYVLIFALLQGSASGVVLGNASLFARSMGASEQLAQTVVTLFSIANCVGRVSSGHVMDKMAFTPKPAFSCIAGVILATTCAFLAIVGDGLPASVACAVVLVPGVTYGANWAIMPAFMAAEFGSHNAGVGFALAAMAVAPVAAVFALATGNFYAAQAARSANILALDTRNTKGKDKDQVESLICYGAQCFRAAVIMATMTATFASLLAGGLWRRIVARRGRGALGASGANGTPELALGTLQQGKSRTLQQANGTLSQHQPEGI